MANKNIGTLQPGQKVTITGRYKATEADMGKTDVVNTVTARSSGFSSTGASAAATMEAVRYAFDATKTQSNQPADGKAFDIGETVTWDIKATNTGNQTLRDLTISELLTDATIKDGAMVQTIAPKESAIKQAQYVIKGTDFGREDLRNSVNISNDKVSKSNVYSPFVIVKKNEVYLEFLYGSYNGGGGATNGAYYRHDEASTLFSVVKDSEYDLRTNFTSYNDIGFAMTFFTNPEVYYYRKNNNDDIFNYTDYAFGESDKLKLTLNSGNCTLSSQKCYDNVLYPDMVLRNGKSDFTLYQKQTEGTINSENVGTVAMAISVNCLVVTKKDTDFRYVIKAFDDEILEIGKGCENTRAVTTQSECPHWHKTFKYNTLTYV